MAGGMGGAGRAKVGGRRARSSSETTVGISASAAGTIFAWFLLFEGFLRGSCAGVSSSMSMSISSSLRSIMLGPGC